MASSHKIKLKHRKKSRKLKIKKLSNKIKTKCCDKKFECAFHEIGHFVVMNHYRPLSKKIITINNIEGTWVGCVSEPEESKKAGWASSADFLLTLGKVAISGAIAESIYKTHNKGAAWKLLLSGKKTGTFKNDYQNFKISHGYLKPRLDKYIKNPNSMQEYFEYLYELSVYLLTTFDLRHMINIAEKLCTVQKLTGEEALKNLCKNAPTLLSS